MFFFLICACILAHAAAQCPTTISTKCEAIGDCKAHQCSCLQHKLACYEQDSNSCLSEITQIVSQRQQLCPNVGTCDADALEACLVRHDNKCLNTQTCDCFDSLESCYFLHPHCDNTDGFASVENTKNVLQCELSKTCPVAARLSLETCLTATSDCGTSSEALCACLAEEKTCHATVGDQCSSAVLAKAEVDKSITALCTITGNACDDQFTLDACVGTALGSAACADDVTACDCIKARLACHENRSQCDGETAIIADLTAQRVTACNETIVAGTTTLAAGLSGTIANADSGANRSGFKTFAAVSTILFVLSAQFF